MGCRLSRWKKTNDCIGPISLVADAFISAEPNMRQAVAACELRHEWLQCAVVSRRIVRRFGRNQDDQSLVVLSPVV
jgi:hypothetical protein